MPNQLYSKIIISQVLLLLNLKQSNQHTFQTIHQIKYLKQQIEQPIQLFNFLIVMQFSKEPILLIDVDPILLHLHHHQNATFIFQIISFLLIFILLEICILIYLLIRLISLDLIILPLMQSKIQTRMLKLCWIKFVRLLLLFNIFFRNNNLNNHILIMLLKSSII